MNLASFNISPQGVMKFQGQWTVKGIIDLDKQLEHVNMGIYEAPIEIDCSQIQDMDSAGALLIYTWIERIKKQGNDIKAIHLQKEYQALIQLVSQHAVNFEKKLAAPPSHSFLYSVGKEAVEKFQQFLDFLSFFGEFVIAFLKEIKNPFNIQWLSVVNTIEDTGYRALPIIALLLFLIGVVLTYQMGLQLKNYGATAFIVNLSGITILREFSPLITAIIIAGRTSSSFTALISTMKVYEEIDALKVMGLSPMERIVLPRVIGLTLSLPLLTIWASIFGILGSMIMANIMLEISYVGFFQRFFEVVEFKEYWIGMSKTPIFALIIAVIGCYQGFQGALSADSVGRQTTKSVVQSIFMIIIADAAFSVAYSWLGL